MIAPELAIAVVPPLLGAAAYAFFAFNRKKSSPTLQSKKSSSPIREDESIAGFRILGGSLDLVAGGASMHHGPYVVFEGDGTIYRAEDGVLTKTPTATAVDRPAGTKPRG